MKLVNCVKTFFHVQVQVESYVKAVKVSAMDKVKALLANQMAGYQQAAREHEAAAKDICEAEAAQTRALIVGEAESVILQKDANLHEVASCFRAPRSSLSNAWRMAAAAEEAELTEREVLDLLTLQGEIPVLTGERAKHMKHMFNYKVQSEVRNRVRGESQER